MADLPQPRRKEFKRSDLLIGILFGIVLMFGIYFLSLFINSKNNKKSDLNYPIETGTKLDTVKVGNYTLEIKQRNEVQIKEQTEVLEEKIKSFNDRIGDLYLSLTIIVALLLSIVIGVYVKTEAEVAKHMNKNYGQYKAEIEEMNAQAQKQLAEIQSKNELAELILSKQIDSKQQEAPE